MTLALCPLTQAELMCSALGFNMENIPLCERLLTAWLDAHREDDRQRTQPDGEETCNDADLPTAAAVRGILREDAN